MRRVVYTLALGIFISLSLNAQQRSEDFYYYWGEKIYLQQRKDKIYVKFTSSANREQLRTLSSRDTSLQTYKESLDNGVLRFSVFESKNRNEISAISIESHKASPDVISVNYMLESNGKLRGLTDEFIVMLKNTTSFSQLEALAKENNCTIVDEIPFVETWRAAS